jgi:hypothetical protein
MARPEKVVDISTAKPKKNPAAVALGRMGGLKGGNARAASMTPEKRVEIARKAAAKRWEGKKKPGDEYSSESPSLVI